ncbi:MAG: carboxypeptidase regulatory-like domain-containing protein [Bacteroidota bacterium]
MLCFLAPALSFGQAVGSLTGQVKDRATDAPIANARVLIKQTGIQARSGASGTFRISSVPLATYVVVVEADGYQQVEIRNVLLERALAVNLDIYLNEASQGGTYIILHTPDLLAEDASGFAKNYSSADLTMLPYRNIDDVVRTQAGVISFDGQPGLYMRGNRASDVQYTLDGFNLDGDFHNNIPYLALNQLSVETGHMGAAYGDKMGGMVHLSLKSDAQRWFGLVEGQTSESFDAFGYNAITGAAGGPLLKGRVNLLLAGTYEDQFDSTPSALGQLRVKPEVLEDLRAFPMAFSGTDVEGNRVYLPIPFNLENGASLMVDNDGFPVLTDGHLTFSDGVTIDAQNLAPADIQLGPVQRASVLTPDAFSVEDALLGRQKENLLLLGNLSVKILPRTQLRIGALFNQQERDWFDETSNRRVLFAPEMTQRVDQEEQYLHVALRQRFSANTLLHFQGSYRSFSQTIYDPRLGENWENLFFYGDIDDPAFMFLSSYKFLSFENEIRIDDHGTPNDPSDDTEFTVRVPFFPAVYGDGNDPAGTDEVINSLVQIPGGRYNAFQQRSDARIRMSGYFTAGLGLHQVTIGGAYEKHTNRFWYINASNLAPFYADGNPERIDPLNPDFNQEGYTTYEELPLQLLDTTVGLYYGYDLRGQNEVDSEDFDTLLSQDPNKPLEHYNIAPYQSELLSGYVQDQFAWDGLVVEAGVRFQLFDNNTLTVIDPFFNRPVCRVRDLGNSFNGICGEGAVATGIGEDFAIFYSGSTIVGFRDTNGVYYDASGQVADAGTIQLQGQARVTSNVITRDMFTAYDADLIILPRISTRYHLNQNTTLFASYGHFAQAPNASAFATFGSFRSAGTLRNSGLTSEKLAKIELGFHQKWHEGVESTLAGFYNKGSDLIASSINRDLSYSRGIELGLFLAAQPFQVRLNYTLSYSEVEEIPRFFDQRHRLNLAFQLDTPAQFGPAIFGVHPFGKMQLHALLQAGSGFPYTLIEEPVSQVGGARLPTVASKVNELRMPGQVRADLHIARRFVYAGSAEAVLFLQVQNLFNRTNSNKVWPFTGQLDNDGYLAMPAGERYLGNTTPTGETLYRHRNRIPEWAGIPRLIRLGVRLAF